MMHRLDLSKSTGAGRLGLLFAVGLLLGATTELVPAEIFTSSQLDPAIYRTDADGGNPSTLDLERLFRGAYHVPEGLIMSDGQLIWTDAEHDGIYTIDLDGTGFRQSVDLDRAFGDDDYVPLGLAQSGRMMFWTDVGRDGIYAAELDGSNPRLLIDLPMRFPGPSYTWGIAATRTQLFWTNWGTGNEGVYTADLNGNNARKLIGFPRLSAFPRGIAAGRTGLFWADSSRQAIYTASFDGSSRRVLVDLVSMFEKEEDGPIGVAVSGSLLYWTDTTQAVYAARVDGRNPVKLFDLPVVATYLAVASTSTTRRPPSITDLRVVTDSPPFLRTWKLTWTSEIAERYRIFLSDDLETWFPASGSWLSNRFETSAEVLLPANMPRAFFRVERE